MSEETPLPPDLPLRAEPAAVEAPATPRKGSRRSLIILVVVGASLLGVGVWIVAAKLPGWLASGESPAGTSASEGKAAAERKIQAKLFFVADDGGELQSSTHDVLYGATPAEQARRIIEAQLQPPPAGRVSAVPAGTKVRAVYLGGKGEAYVDLSAEARTAHGGGSLNEALTVYTIVHALTSNLPGITSVQILIDGREVDTLAGHIDLRHPLTSADGWLRKGPS